MRLRIVPARAGVQWARAGMRTFWRQPLALTGLFFMLFFAISVVALVPLAGVVLTQMLMPAAGVGFMAAAEQVEAGRFPLPAVLIAGLRRGGARAMLLLGALHAASMALLVAISALIDGGRFAWLYASGQELTFRLMERADSRAAFVVAALLSLPVSILFWHAAALVHWYGVPPLKGLFFSAVAAFKNIRAFLLYGAAWLLMSFAAGLLLMMLALAAGTPMIADIGLGPVLLLMAAMLLTSLWFTFRDSFAADDPPPAL